MVVITEWKNEKKENPKIKVLLFLTNIFTKTNQLFPWSGAGEGFVSGNVHCSYSPSLIDS